MKVDTNYAVSSTAQEAMGNMMEEHNVATLSQDLTAFNEARTRAICILDDCGKKGAGYKFVVIGAYRITQDSWVATYFNDEFEDAIDAMVDAQNYLKRPSQN